MTKNYELSYEELLNLTIGYLRTNHAYILNKCLNGLSPEIMNDILAVSKCRYNTRLYKLFVNDRPKTDRYGQNSIELIRYGTYCPVK